MLLTITNNNQHLRFRVSSVSHFWLIFLPNNKILQNPPKFQSASPENRPQNSGLGKNIIFRWTHSFIQKGGVKSKVWFRWSLPFLGGKNPRFPCPCPFFLCHIFSQICQPVGNVSMLLIFRNRFVSPGFSPTLELPRALTGSFETFATCQSKSGIYRKRCFIAEKKIGRWFFFGQGNIRVGFLERKGQFWFGWFFHDCIRFDIVMI